MTMPTDEARTRVTAARRIVVKIGSSLVTAEGAGLDHAAIADWARQMAVLLREGIDVVLISSGAVAEGMKRLGWRERPRHLHNLQAAAATGQMGMVQAYEAAFIGHGLHTAQVLLTHDDLADRHRYLNARSTLRTLLHLGVVPVVNENDTVATDEFKLGDNDTLAGLVSNLIEADVLVILTDQSGLYDRDPRTDPEARLVSTMYAGDPELEAMAGGGGRLGRGGMRTKVEAASRAARSGAATVIAGGHEPDVLTRLVSGESLGTILLPRLVPLNARKQWLAGQLAVNGTLCLDAGAVKVLRESGRSLLPVGVRDAIGDFDRGDLVACVDPDGREVARGLVNYSAAETRQIMGQASGRIEALLGYVDDPELIHRDNLVILD